MPLNLGHPNFVLEEALFYQSMGWSVIPVKANSKEPAVAWAKFQSERADETQIREWFEKTNYNLGIITGDISGHLLVVDMDVKQGLDGDDTLADLCMQHGGTVPDTIECHTGGGGRHLFFKYPPGVVIPNSRGTATEGLGPGIDVRGNGGFVVAAPSTHSSGRSYVWSADMGPHDVEVKNIPSWLLDLVKETPVNILGHPSQIRKVVDNTGEFDAFGQRIDGRENHAFKLVSGVFYSFLENFKRVPTVEEVFADVSSVYFAQTAGTKAELEAQGRGETMLWSKAQYILERYHKGRLPPPVSTGTVGGSAGGRYLPDDPAGPSGHPVSEQEPGSKSIGELSSPPTPREWTVENLVPAHEVTSLYGDGGVGKSLLAQQMATSVAMGKKFLGLETIKTNSLYISCEDDYDELQRRQYAINKHNGVVLGSTVDGRLWSRTGFDNIMVTWPMDGQAVISPFVERIITEIELHQIGLLILDNISDLYGGNENHRAQVNHFAKAVLGGIIRRCGVTIVLLGHPPKNPEADYSGSTAWNAAVRARHQLCKPENGMDDERQLMCRKSNYSVSSDLMIDLVWQEGVFIIPASTDGDTVARINYKNIATALLDRVEKAWSEGRPYTAKRDHPRSLDRLMMDSVSLREDRNAMRKALQEAKRDEWIEVSRTGQKRGYRLAAPPPWYGEK